MHTMNPSEAIEFLKEKYKPGLLRKLRIRHSKAEDMDIAIEYLKGLPDKTMDILTNYKILFNLIVILSESFAKHKNEGARMSWSWPVLMTGADLIPFLHLYSEWERNIHYDPLLEKCKKENLNLHRAIESNHYATTFALGELLNQSSFGREILQLPYVFYHRILIPTVKFFDKDTWNSITHAYDPFMALCYLSAVPPWTFKDSYERVIRDFIKYITTEEGFVKTEAMLFQNVVNFLSKHQLLTPENVIQVLAKENRLFFSSFTNADSEPDLKLLAFNSGNIDNEAFKNIVSDYVTQELENLATNITRVSLSRHKFFEEGKEDTSIQKDNLTSEKASKKTWFGLFPAKKQEISQPLSQSKGYSYSPAGNDEL